MLLDDGYTNTERLAWIYVPQYLDMMEVFAKPGLDMIIAVINELRARGYCDELEIFSIMSRMMPDALSDDIAQAARMVQVNGVCVCNCDEYC